MRKILVSVLSLVAFSVLGFAQQEDSFRPHWSLEAQAGAAYTFGEGSFSSMLSPAFSLNVGYHFSEPVEFRLGVGGLSGKGYVASMARYYQYDYVRGQADLLFHSFGNFYTLVGVGLLVGISNGAQQVAAAGTDSFRHLWKAPKAFAAGRFGVGYRFPVGKGMAISAEAVYHLLPDVLNSVHNGVPGGDVQVLAGFHYSFGSKAKAKKAEVHSYSYDEPPVEEPKRDYAAEARAAVEARAEADRARFEAEQERQVVESALRVNQRAEEEAQRVVEEKPVVKEEKPVVEVTNEQFAEALARAIAEAAGISDIKVYFESNSWTVQSQYEPDLQKVATFLMENVDYSVILTAYCDSRYGSAEYNKVLSERRANAVARFLKKAGVDASQILVRPAGGIDTYSKGENVKKNRFVVCEIVK